MTNNKILTTTTTTNIEYRIRKKKSKSRLANYFSEFLWADGGKSKLTTGTGGF